MMGRAESPVEAQVRQVLDRLWAAYAAKDLDGVMACFAPDDDLVAIGTGPDEVAVGAAALREAFRRDFAQAGEIAPLSTGDLAVCSRGEVAWVAAEARAMVAGAEFLGRLTAVLLNRGGRWLIVQQHLSLPAPGQAEGESFPRP